MIVNQPEKTLGGGGGGESFKGIWTHGLFWAMKTHKLGGQANLFSKKLL